MKSSVLKRQASEQLEDALSRLETHLTVSSAVAFGTYTEVHLCCVVLLSDHEMIYNSQGIEWDLNDTEPHSHSN